MKKLLFVLALAPMMVIAAEAKKIVAVDFLVLVHNHPDYERNEKYVESTDRDIQKKIDAIKEEGEKLQEEGRKLADQYRNPMLNEKAKTEVEKKLTDLQQELIKIEQRYRSEVQKGREELGSTRERLLKLTTDDLKTRIKAFAEKNGYDLVVDANSVPYFNPSVDVTDDMLKEMGVDPSSAKGREPEAPKKDEKK